MIDDLGITALVILALAAAALALLRIIRGPSQADRIIALDILLAAAIALAIAAGLLTSRTVFIDVAMGLALVGFVGTIGWARFVEQSGRNGEDR